MSHKSLFDEGVFKDDFFSSGEFERRTQQMDEKRKLFEASEKEQHEQNKAKMKQRMEKVTIKDEPKIVEINSDEEAELMDPKPTPEINQSEDEQCKQDPSEESEEEILTADEINQLVTQANDFKSKGNEFFANALWEGAIEEYTKALDVCPKSQLVRAIYFSNRAASWLNLLKFDETVEDCTEALKIDPKYEKALFRRATAYKQLDKLSEALEDFAKIAELNPKNKEAASECASLPGIIKEKQDREREEMMGKLKEVGNSLLGLVGLSVDNFKFQQDPNTGGYSVQFQQ